MDAAGQQELLAAIKDDDAARVRALLDATPAPLRIHNESGVSAVLLALYYGRGAIAAMLVAHWTPLDAFEAAAFGDGARVRELVAETPALAEAYSPDGFPLLSLAATFGHAGIVEFLLSKGADANAVARSPTGYTALTGAVSHRRNDVIALLLGHGARAAHRYGPGWSPLHEAAMYGDVEVVTWLLEHGADLNARNDDGQTPLGLALHAGKEQAAELLRARGAVE